MFVGRKSDSHSLIQFGLFERLSERCPPLQQTRGNSGLLLALMCLLELLLVAPRSHAGDWERVYTADNLLVERRAYAGSALSEIKGVTRVKASLNAVMALLKDDQFNNRWVYRSGGARILQESGYAQAYVYGVVDAPWPMRDRDTVVRFDYVQQPLTREISITISNFPDFTPLKDEFVRVPDFGGFWHLRPQRDGWVEVTYQVYGDPGGRIPVWLANYAAALSVTRTLQNMGPALQHYTDARSEFVAELEAD